MKKKILAITCLAAALAFVGCVTPGEGGGGQSGNNSNLYNDSQVVVGGNVTSGAAGVQDIVISGVTDLHITTAKTNIAKEIALVTAAKGEEIVEVAADTSKVQFGTQGTYEVTYTAGDVVEKCNVTIYGAMTAGATNNNAVTLKYSEVYTSLTKGVSFKDCFNTELPVEVVTDGGIKNADGSLNLGEYTVKYMATDKAGQSMYATRTVTVVEEKNPSIVAQTYDMADDEFVLNVDVEDFNAFLALSLDGVAVSEDYYTKSNNKITISGDYIFEKFGRSGSVALRYLSAKGCVDTTLTLTDQKTVAVDDSAIAEFAQSYFATFTPHAIPSMICTNPRQSETPVYQVFKDGAEVAVTDQSVTLNKDGDFTLVVTVRNEQYTYNLNAYYNLGFSDGFVLTQATEDTIEQYFDTTKTLLELRLTSFDGTKTHALYKKDSDMFGDLAAFNAAAKALNTTKVYSLRVRAQSTEGELYTQSVHMTVAKEGVVTLLNTEADLKAGKVKPYVAEKSTLTNATKPVAGRRGVFSWYRAGHADRNTALMPNKDLMLTHFVEGNYLTVDVYSVGAKTNLAFFIDGDYTKMHEQFNFEGSTSSQAIYLWNVPKDTEVVNDNGTPNDTSDDTTTVKPALFRVYNDKGERVYSYDKDAWYTFEIYIFADMTYRDYRGFATWSGGADQLYTANWRVSSERIMQDATVNAEVSAADELEDNVVWQPDLWDQGTLF